MKLDLFDPEKSLPGYAERLKAVELYEAFLKAENTYQVFQDAANAGDLSIVAQEALDAYEAHGADLLIDSVSNQVIRCALTGVPLLAEESDSQWVLSAALGLPPRAEEEEGEMMPEMAAAQ